MMLSSLLASTRKNFLNLKRPLSSLDQENVRARARNLANYIDSSPDPYHCIQTSVSMLLNSGFRRISEKSLWGEDKLLKPGGKYFFTRDLSSIIAFGVGGNNNDTSGFNIIGAHTDSPNLRVKPNPDSVSHGIRQVNVSCYGGGLWHTWLDRDLSVAGNLLVRDCNTNRINQRLFKMEDAILRVPSLCIHLTSAADREALTLNKETHIKPMICSEMSKRLNNKQSLSEHSSSSHFLRIISDHINCSPNDIVGFDLSLFDTQKTALSGIIDDASDQCIFGARLDNLASCYVSLEALCAHTSSPAFSQESQVSLVALFDHEEVGSGSAVGAGSTLMAEAVERIHKSLLPSYCDSNHRFSAERLKVAKQRSFILSADMAHAVHPNYASKHDPSHAPYLGGGIVVKHNSNQRYATSGNTAFLVEEIARLSGVPTQTFSVKNDCPCGSTIGPIVSANTGIRAADVGMPQLSMHSIRETMTSVDLTYAFEHFRTFFSKFSEIDDMIDEAKD